MSITELNTTERMFAHSSRFAYLAGTLFGTFIVAPILGTLACTYEDYIVFTAPHRWPVNNDPVKIRYYTMMKELDEFERKLEEENAADKHRLA